MYFKLRKKHMHIFLYYVSESFLVIAFQPDLWTTTPRENLISCTPVILWQNKLITLKILKVESCCKPLPG